MVSFFGLVPASRPGCETICPGVFRLNEALGHSEVIDPRGAPEALIQEAMDQCPAQAISWQEPESP
ncbi:MAG: ferredoxin [Deltaproteobacteria bacterium]|nr:ferredoxin [Deltaproteobacteria bacterium]